MTPQEKKALMQTIKRNMESNEGPMIKYTVTEASETLPADQREQMNAYQGEHWQGIVAKKERSY